MALILMPTSQYLPFPTAALAATLMPAQAAIAAQPGLMLTAQPAAVHVRPARAPQVAAVAEEEAVEAVVVAEEEAVEAELVWYLKRHRLW